MKQKNVLIKGKVAHGQKLGRKLGFPTANIILDEEYTEDFGVFLAEVHLNEIVHYGILSIGRKITVTNNGDITAECSIFDFNEDIYGEELTIKTLEFIRAQQKFNSVEELKLQIGKDVVEAKRILTNNCLKK